MTDKKLNELEIYNAVEEETIDEDINGTKIVHSDELQSVGEKYLPIGTVVLLKEGSKKIMIYGRKQMDTGTNKTYDYVACLYPEGNIGKKQTILFNHENISRVFHKGYSDDENKTFEEKYLK